LINFTVTEAGLEDQLLTLVVKKERPDLAQQQEDLIQQQNGFKIKLAELEADLLQRLNDQKGDILEDIELIENLELSKATSTEINEKVEIAKVTEVQIKEASEVYRPAANRGALVFFLLNELNKVHEFYKFSLGAFIIVINRAIDIVAEQMNPKKEKEDDEEEVEGEEAKEEEEEELELSPRTLALRVQNLIESITFEAFTYARRGTFEVHKLILVSMLCLRVNLRKGLIVESEMNALIKKNVVIDGAPDMKDSLKQFIPE
jgi:dynein heavy chain